MTDASYLLNVDGFFHGVASTRDVVFNTRLEPSETGFWSADVAMAVVVKRNSTGFILHGSLSGQMQTACDVCAEPFEQPIDLLVQEKIVLSQFTMPETEQELTEADFFEVVDPKAILDLRDLARQLIETELATITLCQTHQSDNDS